MGHHMSKETRQFFFTYGICTKNLIWIKTPLNSTKSVFLWKHERRLQPSVMPNWSAFLQKKKGSVRKGTNCPSSSSFLIYSIPCSSPPTPLLLLLPPLPPSSIFLLLHPCPTSSSSPSSLVLPRGSSWETSHNVLRGYADGNGDALRRRVTTTRYVYADGDGDASRTTRGYADNDADALRWHRHVTVTPTATPTRHADSLWLRRRRQRCQRRSSPKREL